jgi:hypothetical protein
MSTARKAITQTLVSVSSLPPRTIIVLVLWLVGAALIAGTNSGFAQEKPVYIGQYKEWGTFAAAPNGRKICFALVRSDQQSDQTVRGPAYIMIASRPQDNVWNEISLLMDYQLGFGSDLTFEVGTKRFPMWTKGDGAWIRNMSEEHSLLINIMAATPPSLTVRASVPKRVVDRYPLSGAKEAIEAAVRECRNPRPAPIQPSPESTASPPRGKACERFPNMC